MNPLPAPLPLFCAAALMLLPTAPFIPAQDAAAAKTGPGWQFQAKLAPAPPDAPLEKAAPAPAAKPLAPLPFALSQVTHHVALSDGLAKVTTSYKGQSFRDEPQLVPLLGGTAQIESVEEKGGTLVAHEDKLWVLTQGMAAFEGKVELSLPLSGDPPVLMLPVVPATSQQIIVSGVPENRRITLNGEAARRLADGDSHFLMPAKGGEATLRLENAEAPKAPPTPSKWRLDARIAARYSDGVVRCEAQLFCHADEGAGVEATVRLPGAAAGIEASGEDLLEGRVLPKVAGEDERKLRLTWKTGEILDRRVTVRYQVPQSPIAPEWTLQAPVADGETRALFALLPVEGIEFSGDGLKGPVPASQLPAGTGGSFAADHYFVAEGGPRLSVKAAVLQRVEPVKATVPKAVCKTLVNSSGAMAVDAQYTVQHRGPVRFTLEIPQGGAVRFCRVNDADVSPVLRGSALEFWLPVPEEKEGSVVTVCYHLKGVPLDPVSGKLTLELPKTDLFSDSLTWTLQLPDACECSAFEGNVEADAAAAGAPAGTVSFKKLLGQGEAPAVEVYYQRKGLQE